MGDFYLAGGVFTALPPVKHASSIQPIAYPDKCEILPNPVQYSV